MNWEKLVRRFGFYMLGLFLGCVLVWFMLIRGRNDLPDMWPQGRVHDMFNRATFENDSLSLCWLNCFSADGIALHDFTQQSTVRFGQSKPRENPKIYRLEGWLGNMEVQADLALRDSIYQVRFIRDLSITHPITCNCP